MNRGHPPAGDKVAIVASVLCGHSERGEVTFVPGAPVGPLSLGTQGHWKINAEGVAATHIFLHFDGRDLFACSVARAMLAGVPLDKNWVRVGLPCELRFEGACIIFRKESPSAPPMSLPITKGDGGALFHAAKRAVEAAMNFGPAAPPPGDSPHVQRMPQGAENLNRTMLVQGRPALPSDIPPVHAPADPVHRQTPAPAPARADKPPEDAEDGVDEPPKAGLGARVSEFWRSAPPVRKVTVLLVPLALAGGYFVFFSSEPPAPGPKRPSAAATASPSPRTATAGPASPAGAQANAGGVDRGGVPSFPAVAGSQAPPPPSTPPPPSVAPTGAGAKQGTAPQKTAGRSSSGGRSPEREALDNAAAGSFEDAAKRYEALSAAHPDNTAYKEAARILHAKAAPPNGQ